jgi:phospholipase/carboxylesterase
LGALNLGAERDGFVYAPSGYDATRPAPFALMLHGAHSGAWEGLAPFLDLADGAGLILLAPESRGRTWDVLLEGYGPDVEFIDRTLGSVFSRCAVDPFRLAACGFSDGAFYALSLGPINGDLFTHVIAFSPGGFDSTEERRGAPGLFVSHGTRDGDGGARAEQPSEGWQREECRASTRRCSRWGEPRRGLFPIELLLRYGYS